jgi:protein tyrosine phosphatase (PTP) superfamily phosphohydrolase (DUF442 family)
MPALNFDVDFNSDTAIAPIAEAAWNKVRGKDDATFNGAVRDFQHTLLAHCRSALRTNPLSGNTNLARFEQEVARLQGEARK